ncbi:hypothetical protein F4Z99_19825 [Candidatus Poribacteria bacterium]|nr:hypothetical protein [Candidatus Poribacteria bacterium]
MNTRHLRLLFSLIILLDFCTGLFCWAEGMIVYAYRGTTYMMAPNDTIPTRITEEGISTPSPDGRFLAAVDSDPDRRNLLHIRDLHTGKRIRSIILQVHSYVDISWSPDGRWIVYAGNIERLRAGRDLGTEIFLISPDGRHKRKLRHPIGESPIGFVWAPDAQSVFYNLASIDRRQEIWESKINGQENPKKHLLFHEGAGFLSRYPFYSFSPNAKKIAYTSLHEGVFVADAEGKNHRKVTDRVHENVFPDAVGVGIQVFVNHRLQQFFQVDWSPNGKHLVFSAETLDGNYGLYIYSFASEEARRLVLLRDSLPILPRWVGDSLPVQPSNKMAVTWGSLKRKTETD